jgi:chromosome segregation ATPase
MGLQAELSAARAARDSALLEAEHKACALSESQREVQALQGSLQSAEKRAAAAENDAARRAAQVHGSLSAEVVALTRRAEEAELKLTQAHNELESLRSELDATRQQASEAASALSAAAAELENERKARKACEQEARRGAAAAGKDLEAAELEADQRRAQVCNSC